MEVRIGRQPIVVRMGENTARALAAALSAEADADRAEGAAGVAVATLGSINGRHAARTDALLEALAVDLPASTNAAGFTEYLAFDATTGHADNVSRRHGTLGDVDTNAASFFIGVDDFFTNAMSVTDETGATVTSPANTIPWNYSRAERTVRMSAASAFKLTAAQFALEQPFVFYVRAYRTAGVNDFDVALLDGTKFMDVYSSAAGSEDATLLGQFAGTTYSKTAAIFGLSMNGVEAEEIEMLMLRNADGFQMIVNNEEEFQFSGKNINGGYLEMFDPTSIEIGRTAQPLDVAEILIANVDASFNEQDARALFKRRHPYIRAMANAAQYGDRNDDDGTWMHRIPGIAAAWETPQRVEGLLCWFSSSSPSSAETPGQTLTRPFAYMPDVERIEWLDDMQPFVPYSETAGGLATLPAFMRSSIGADAGTIYAVYNMVGTGMLVKESRDGGRTFDAAVPAMTIAQAASILGVGGFSWFETNSSGSWVEVTEGAYRGRLLTTVYTNFGVHTFWRDPNGTYGISPAPVNAVGHVPNESSVCLLPGGERVSILCRSSESAGGGNVLNERLIYEASVDGTVPVLVRTLTYADDGWIGSASGMGSAQIDPEGVNGVKGLIVDLRSRAHPTNLDTRFGTALDIYGADYNSLYSREIMGQRKSVGYMSLHWLPKLNRGLVPFESSLDGFNGQSGTNLAVIELSDLDLRSPPPVPSSLQFIRSATQPATGAQAGSSNGVPVGSDPLWYSFEGGDWTRIVGADTEAPFTVTAAFPGSVTVTGKTATRSNATRGFAEGEVLLPSYNGGSRLRAKLKNVSDSAFASIWYDSGAPGGGEFYGAIGFDTGSTLGYSGGGTTALAVDDILDIRRDGVTMAIYNNGALVGSAGVTTYAGATTSSPGAGAAHLVGQNTSIEFLSWMPLGPNAPIKVAQTSPDGSTWRVPTAGDTHLRVSNDAGITAPSVVIA